MKRKNIFENVNFWLQFSEAKNGALLAFNGVILFSTLNLYSDYKKLPNFDIIVLLFLLFITVSIIITIISFFPNTKIGQLKKDKNVIFWKTIASFSSSDEYAKALETEINEIDHHVEDEIFINSKITESKYKLFKYALYATISGFILMAFYTFVLLTIRFFCL